MSREKILVRRLSGDHPHVDLTGDDRRFSAARIVLVLTAIAFTLIVVVERDLGTRLVMGSFAVLAAATAGSVTLLRRLSENGVVRIDTEGPGLHFRPPIWPTALTVVLLLLFTLPAVAVAVGGADDLFTPRRSPMLLVVVVLVFFGVMLWRLRIPSGLRLTVDGIRGIRARGDLAWSWDEVGAVEVSGPPAALSLTRKDGYVPVTATMRFLGSDPNQVAAIVRFFRDNPAERAVLEQGGRAALDRAAEVLRPM
ncbi:MAG: murein endopeptidase [Microbacterium sp.]|jgi:hypothetical protein|nr:murein endopeptidase [Microbacterium sp.]